ncbi:MAG: hypothetical protein AAF800_01420 [Planctomycetota bacterium]
MLTVHQLLVRLLADATGRPEAAFADDLEHARRHYPKALNGLDQPVPPELADALRGESCPEADLFIREHYPVNDAGHAAPEDVLRFLLTLGLAGEAMKP